MNLTSDQKQVYFEARLPGQKLLADGRGSIVKCIFHDDQKPSLSINLEKGVWKCHATCGQGGILDFEKKFSSCDDETAWANIAEVCGLEQPQIFRSKPEAIYGYCDEDGNLLFEKLRFAGKKFPQRHKSPDGKWIYNLDDCRKVLYHLPELITANHVAICEGEKDADNVNALHLENYGKGNERFTATTNFEGAGAGKWRPEYSPYFIGKHVVIFPDNDQPGRDHAQNLAASVAPYARDVRVVQLPNLAEKGDVSDYLETHSAQELLAIIQKTPVWRASVGKLLVTAPVFLETTSQEIDWMVRDVIQCGSNGFICSHPKVGKSWAAVDLALALALREPWIGFEVTRRVKVALITREDNPALTRWRMDRFLRGRGRQRHELDGWLYVNSRDQSADFRLDKPDLLGAMITALKAIQTEFAIFDVFNVMHGSDENENTEMRKIMEQANIVQREVGCSICFVHHFIKSAEGTLTQRIRGAGAIAGWAEWAIGIEKVPNDTHTRRMEFELKAGVTDPIFYEIVSGEADSSSAIRRVEQIPEPPKRMRRAEQVLQ